MTKAPTIEFGFNAAPPKDFETELREALNHPVNMKRIVSEMEAALEITDLAAVKRHLEILQVTSKLCKFHYGKGMGGTFRVLNDATHRARARVVRADMAGEIDYPDNPPINANTVRQWKSRYGFLSAEELEELMRNRKRPLTQADLRRRKLDMEFRSVTANYSKGETP